MIIDLSTCAVMMRLSLAATSNHPDILNALSLDSRAMVRWQVAKNRWSSPELLDRLSKDPNPSVRSVVAANVHTSSATLDALAKDRVAMVRAWVVSNHNIWEETFELLAADKSKDVVAEVARVRKDIDWLLRQRHDAPVGSVVDV
jgi:hypothetical protein